ncbi:endothelin-converting enzyme 1-like [Dermacentor variabilis]|uniref:endothelin-converting enzyme 1-like n=1 Tax=Dermacentor variabilis TaxID=34621 RepID=UPI003F5C77CD
MVVHVARRLKDVLQMEPSNETLYAEENPPKETQQDIPSKSAMPATSLSSAVVSDSNSPAPSVRRARRQRRPQVMSLTVAGVLFGVLLSAVLAMLFLKPAERTQKEATVTQPPDGCLTVDCRFVADELLQAMNQSAEPCDDFYEYMCGNYNGPEANMFAAVEETIRSSLKALLKSTNVPETGQDAWEKAAGMFQSCMDLDVTRNTQMADLRQWLASQRLDFFNITQDHSYDVVDALVMFSLQYHLPALLALEVDRMRFLNKKRAISFTIYEDDIEWYTHYHIANGTNHRGRRSSYETNLNHYGLRGDALKAMSRSLEDYGTQVAVALDRYAKQPATIAAVTIAGLGNLTEGHVDSVRWASIFGRYTGGIYHGEDYIQVVPSAPALLVALLSSPTIGPHGLRCLLAWSVLRFVGDLVETASADAEANSRPFDNVCYDHVLLVMEPVFMRKYDEINANTGAAGRARDMIGNIKVAFKRFLFAFKWMGDEVQNLMEHKLADTAALVGYPESAPDAHGLNDYYDELDDSTPPRFFHDWRKALELYARRLVRDQVHMLFLSVKANVSYSPAANAIIVPAASLQPGLFFQQGPASVNYGGLGTVVAREMTQIMNLQALTLDQPTAVEWNGSDTAKHYASSARCLLKSQKEALHRFHAESPIESPDSAILADFMGLLAAHAAFTDLPKEERAVRLHRSPLSSDQTFYAFHCAKLCELNGNASSQSRQATARLRCVVPLMNSEAFAEAFDCPASSPMNPSKKCSVW